MRVREVEGHGGVRLHVREAGPEDAPAIVLIHGWSQHHLAWSKQLAGPLAARFRLVAPDLRGHGASAKPEAAAAYDTSTPWAGDIAALIEALGLGRPVLVGWSMGGWVACDHLEVHGSAGIAGLVLVGTGVVTSPELAATRRPDARAEGMYSEDQSVALDAAIAFVRACSAAPLSKQDLATMVGFNMLVPPHVRRAARLRDVDYRAALAALDCPAMVVQGAAERVCTPAMFEATSAALPAARVEVMPGVGHLPFWEDAPRFDALIGEFADQAFGTSP